MISPLDLLQAEVMWAERKQQAEQAGRRYGVIVTPERPAPGGWWPFRRRRPAARREPSPRLPATCATCPPAHL